MTVAELQSYLSALVAADPAVLEMEVLTDGTNRTTYPTGVSVIELRPTDAPMRRAVEIA